MRKFITLTLSILLTTIAIAQTTGGVKEDDGLPQGGNGPSGSTTELAAFNATVNDDKTIFSWTIEEMSGVTGFEIQISADGDNFEAICETLCQGSERGRMSFTQDWTGDLSGTTYFRLMTADRTGNAEYSHTIRVESSEEFEELEVISATPVVYPSLTRGSELYLETGFEGSIQIFNTSGALVAQKNLNRDRTIDISQLPASHYVIAFASVDGSISTQQFIRQ